MDERHGLDERRYRELDWKRVTEGLSPEEVDELERTGSEIRGQGSESTPASGRHSNRGVDGWLGVIEGVLIGVFAIAWLLLVVTGWLACTVAPQLAPIYGVIAIVGGVAGVLAFLLGLSSGEREWLLLVLASFYVVFGVLGSFGQISCDG